MPRETYTVTFKDGHRQTFDGPPGMSDADLVQRARQERGFAGGDIATSFAGGATRHLLEDEPDAVNALLGGAASMTGVGAPVVAALPFVTTGLKRLSQLLATGHTEMPGAGELASDAVEGAIGAYGGPVLKAGAQKIRQTKEAISAASKGLPSWVRALGWGTTKGLLIDAATSQPVLGAVEQAGDILAPGGIRKATGSVLRGLTPGVESETPAAFLGLEAAGRRKASEARRVADWFKGQPDRPITIRPRKPFFERDAGRLATPDVAPSTPEGPSRPWKLSNEPEPFWSGRTAGPPETSGGTDYFAGRPDRPITIPDEPGPMWPGRTAGPPPNTPGRTDYFAGQPDRPITVPNRGPMWPGRQPQGPLAPSIASLERAASSPSLDALDRAGLNDLVAPAEIAPSMAALERAADSVVTSEAGGAKAAAVRRALNRATGAPEPDAALVSAADDVAPNGHRWVEDLYGPGRGGYADPQTLAIRADTAARVARNAAIDVTPLAAETAAEPAVAAAAAEPAVAAEPAAATAAQRGGTQSQFAQWTPDARAARSTRVTKTPAEPTDAQLAALEAFVKGSPAMQALLRSQQ